MVGGYGCTAMIIIILILPISSIFVPFNLVCYFLTWFAGLLALIMLCAALYGFDITDKEDWKHLLIWPLIPALLAAGLFVLGKLVGDMHLVDLLRMITDLFR